MGAPRGFTYEARGNDVAIFHHGRRAARLSGAAAQRFLAEIETRDSQQVMARLTGNYKRGNERMGKEHPRGRRSG